MVNERALEIYKNEWRKNFWCKVATVHHECSDEEITKFVDDVERLLESKVSFCIGLTLISAIENKYNAMVEE